MSLAHNLSRDWQGAIGLMVTNAETGDRIFHAERIHAGSERLSEGLKSQFVDTASITARITLDQWNQQPKHQYLSSPEIIPDRPKGETGRTIRPRYA